MLLLHDNENNSYWLSRPGKFNVILVTHLILLHLLIIYFWVISYKGELFIECEVVKTDIKLIFVSKPGEVRDQRFSQHMALYNR